MAEHREDDPAIGTGYATAQLLASLRAASTQARDEDRAHALSRARKWLATILGITRGTVVVGDRAPEEGTPVWVTPDVLRGGFTSGSHAAGGPLLPHERALADAWGITATTNRFALNNAHLTNAGLAALERTLEQGDYRVRVPEEGALLAIRWLIDSGENERAAAVLETLAPWFDRLRFYPQPGTPQPEPGSGLSVPVLLAPAERIAAALERKAPSADVEAMREAVEVWAPIVDALAAVLLETVDGATPRLEGAPRAPQITGGAPLSRVPPDFARRRAELLARIERARAENHRCRRPHRRGEVLQTLHEGLVAMDPLRADDSLAASPLARRVRTRLAGFVTAYGVPGSPEHARLRASQRVGPSHALLGHVVARRLGRAAAPGEGLEAPRLAAVPIAADEATRALPAGTEIPASIARRLDAAREATLPGLLAAGLVPSGEVLATLLPQVTGPALATRFDDPRARRLYAASYRAFGKRRSLLLLWLQHQVRFAELPWIAALEAASGRDPAPGVATTLRELAALAIDAFPGTPTPSKLVSELAALAAQAGLAADASHNPLPLVEELAADIFMGTFSIKFLRAAQLAARRLGPRSAYARYYGLDTDRVLAMEGVEQRWGVATCPEFDTYCVELAALPTGGNPQARNGTVIERASILTTHNLAALFTVLELEPLLRRPTMELARSALTIALDALERRVLTERVPFQARLQANRAVAGAWRQALFFASCGTQRDGELFASEAQRMLGERSPLARERFTPVLRGLEEALSGDGPSRDGKTAPRLYGWSVERPFLFGSG